MKLTLLLSLFLLGNLINLNATVHTVTLSGDDLVSPQEGMLRYYIENAVSGDIIEFNVDHIDLAGELDISSKTITILGGEGVVIDGNNIDRVFNISFGMYSKVVLKNLTIQNGFQQDESLAWGGGMYAYGMGDNEDFWVENCTFLNNEVNCNGDGQGGALRTRRGTFVNCLFLDNAVTGNGISNGGGAVMSVGGIFINCVFAGNSAKYGGGIYASTDSKIINCTITQNTSSSEGKGAGLSIESGSTSINSIIFDNYSGAVQDNLDVYDATLSYCAMEQGNALVGSNNNIGLSDSPFADAANGQFGLAQNSLCIDAGNSTLPEITEFDLAGNQRIEGSAIDLGAFENSLGSSTSLNPIPKNRFEVYPNPVESILNIDADKVYNICLIDPSGNILFQSKMEGHQQTIEVENLPKGIYFIKFYNDQEVHVEKIVKK
jgi:predicted outer membrane repeat protein